WKEPLVSARRTQTKPVRQLSTSRRIVASTGALAAIGLAVPAVIGAGWLISSASAATPPQPAPGLHTVTVGPSADAYTLATPPKAGTEPYQVLLTGDSSKDKRETFMSFALPTLPTA